MIVREITAEGRLEHNGQKCSQALSGGPGIRNYLYSPVDRKMKNGYSRCGLFPVETNLPRKIEMKRMIPPVLILFLVIASALQATGCRTAGLAPKEAGYDPARDAAGDIKQAVEEAERTGKRILLEVGGDWCIWCREMERFFAANEDLLSLRDRNYITVKINYSPENQNEDVLSKYPAISGYPHIFVLEKDGALLHSQDTAELEDGQSSYDLNKFTTFLELWAPAVK